MIRFLRQVHSLFDRRERWQLLGLTGALIIRAGAELIGVASVAPFMSVLADPTIIDREPWLSWAYATFGFVSLSSFITALGLAVLGIVTITSAVSALALWAMLRFSWSAHHRLSLRLLDGYLRQPYSFFIQRNTSTLNKAILSDTRFIIEGVVAPVLNIMARALVIAAITGLLITLDPFVAFLIVVVLGSVYFVLFKLAKRLQHSLAKDWNDANTLRFKTVEEAFGGIKDLKVLQREREFRARFALPSWVFSRTTATAGSIAQMPRYILELVSLTGLVLIVLYHIRSGQALAVVIPLVSVYAFAGYRLVPELQQVFTAIASIRFYRPALEAISDDLHLFESPAEQIVQGQRDLSFGETIRFEGVTFKYPGAHDHALKDVSLTINRNQRVGLVGETGSGKTTLVDLLLGLFQPASGRLLIDGVPLDGRSIPAWRKQVGYVPQTIFLCDDTISNNIAFGLPDGQIDQERVERAARVAQLHEFIQTLDEKYATLVGERGVRLSGGQRQRIGLARALYHDPAVLVLDEATSALDEATEDAVLEAVRHLSGTKTIIMIAHRFTTVRNADVIYELSRGQLISAGKYEDFMRHSISTDEHSDETERPTRGQPR